MKINEVEITGFKGIHHLIIHPKQINILVGKNNTGKTSILEAINCTLGANKNMMERYDPHLTSLINVNEKEAKVLIKMENENKFLLLSKPELNEIVPEFKKQIMDKMKSIPLLRSNNKKEWLKAEELFDKLLSKPELISEIEKMSIKISGSESTFYLFPFTSLMLREIEPLIDFVNKEISHMPMKDYFPFLFTRSFRPTDKGEKPLTFIKTLTISGSVITSSDKSKINDIENYLKKRKILDNLERFDLDKLLFKTNGVEYEIPFSFMGDGFKALVGLIARTSNETKIILLEEPETHMHPAYIKEIIRQIINFAMEKNIQFFITTHNSDILDIVSLDTLEPVYQEYLDKELNIIRLETYQKDIVAHEINRLKAKDLEDIKLDLRGR